MWGLRSRFKLGAYGNDIVSEGNGFILMFNLYSFYPLSHRQFVGLDVFREEKSQVWPCRTGDSLPMRSCITVVTRKHCSPGQASLTDPSERSMGGERMTGWENKIELKQSQSQWSSLKPPPDGTNAALGQSQHAHGHHAQQKNMLRNRQSLWHPSNLHYQKWIIHLVMMEW